jgi:hypothetical protein
MSDPSVVPHASRPHLMSHRIAILLMLVTFAVACDLMMLLSLNSAETYATTSTDSFAMQPSPLLATAAITSTPQFDVRRFLKHRVRSSAERLIRIIKDEEADLSYYDEISHLVGHVRRWR